MLCAVNAGGDFRGGLQVEDDDHQRRGSFGASVGYRWTGQMCVVFAVIAVFS